MIDKSPRNLCVIICIICMLAIAPVSAGDFRALDFGDSCLNVAAAEYRLGNTAKTQSGDESDQHAFHGVFLDRAVSIVYYCGTGGSLERGMYEFELVNETDLDAFFRLARSNLEYLLGPPTFEGSKLDLGRRYDSFDYALRWDRARTKINVKVVGNFDGQAARKRLQIWFRPNR